MEVRGRFAPSPTGRLHLGNVRTALLAWLQVRRAGGRFILRIEDIDRQRSRDEYLRGIYEDLHWLGFDWDEGPDVGGRYGPYVQSERHEWYRGVLDDWRRRDLVYPCTCSRKDLQAAGAPHSGEEGPVYPGLCRGGVRRTDRRPAWRFRVSSAATLFHDEVLGPQEQRIAEQTGDFVIWRVDDWPSYQLAVVADDAAMEVTDVVRGADLLSSTARQLLLFAALGKTAPRWHHMPMWFDEQGERLAKRKGSMTVEALRESGVSREEALAAIGASLGWPVPPRIALDELLDERFALPGDSRPVEISTSGRQA